MLELRPLIETRCHHVADPRCNQRKRNNKHKIQTRERDVALKQNSSSNGGGAFVECTRRARTCSR